VLDSLLFLALYTVLFIQTSIVKNISPTPVKTSMLLLFGVFFVIGVEIVTFMYWYFMALTDFAPLSDDMKNTAFFIPMCLSLIQLAFTFIVFKNESPKYLCEHGMDQKGSTELQKFYTTVEARIEEFDVLQNAARESKHQYPTYWELSSKKYIGWIFTGILIVLLRADCASYLFRRGKRIDPVKDSIIELLWLYPILIVVVFILSMTITRSTSILNNRI